MTITMLLVNTMKLLKENSKELSSRLRDFKLSGAELASEKNSVRYNPRGNRRAFNQIF